MRLAFLRRYLAYIHALLRQTLWKRGHTGKCYDESWVILQILQDIPAQIQLKISNPKAQGDKSIPSMPNKVKCDKLPPMKKKRK